MGRIRLISEFKKAVATPEANSELMPGARDPSRPLYLDNEDSERMLSDEEECKDEP